MDFLNRITIKNRLLISFTLIIFLFVGFALFLIFEMNKLGQLTTTLYEHPLRVSNAALRASMGVIKMHRSMKDLSMSLSDLERSEAIQEVRSEEKIVYEQLDIVRKKILGEVGKKLDRETRELFSGWKPIRNEVIGYVMEGDKENAALITKRKGADYVALLENKMLNLTRYARDKADGFMAHAEEIQGKALKNTIVSVASATLFLSLITFLMIQSILSNISRLRSTMSEITKTGTFAKSDLAGNSEITDMARHFNLLIDKLQHQFWVRDGLNELNRELSGNLSHAELVSQSISFVSRYADACAGALYTYSRENERCELKATFAFVERKYLSSQFRPGEGIVGQVALEKKPILLKNITREDAVGHTGTVSEPPRSIYAIPLLYEDELHGVLEVASFEDIRHVKQEFLDMAGQVIANCLYTASQNERIRSLLESTQLANEALKNKTRELNQNNERLQVMNNELQAQSVELQVQAEELKSQKMELESRRVQVEEANRLKSEFLSNMSHELRTPLNSILALSQLMIAQGTGKDVEKEIEYLKVVERNGRNLLSLINDILDLSKIEAGRMALSLTDFNPWHLLENILETMRPLADEKGLRMLIRGNEDLTLRSDEERVRQILLNLFSNAIKFTERGEVRGEMLESDGHVIFHIRDTGIGISDADIPHIFNAFQQLDGSTTRQHEGTGLGLSICQKLAALLEGEITVESLRGEGSTFTLTLPLRLFHRGTPVASQIRKLPSPPQWKKSPIRNQKPLLVVDDDQETCALIENYLSASDYEVVTAHNGKEGLALARRLKPFAIILDILMPEMDGWEVLRELKTSGDTADIPVIIISVSYDRPTATALGAVGYIVKPVERNLLLSELSKVAASQEVYRILVVDDDFAVREHLGLLLNDQGYVAEFASDGKNALAQATAFPPDAMILDLMMPEMDGFTVLNQIRKNPATQDLPVIILTSKDLTPEDQHRLKDASPPVVKKEAMNKTRLLRQIEDALKNLNASGDAAHAEEKPVILVVEDDEIAMLQIRSALEEHDYVVHAAFRGADTLEFVQHKIPDALVMDLMMPEMDGFEVLEQIRSFSGMADLPVLVLTAKELTADDHARLTHCNVRQLIRKGSVNRDELVHCVAALLESPESDLPESPDLISDDAPSESPLSSGEKDKTILIVEDNSDNLFTISAILDGAGYAYITAENGKEVVEKVAIHFPDLVLMDIQLPVMNGLDATRQIRSDERMAKIPVVAVTASAMKGDREKILEAGCDDYLSKPIDPSELIHMIRKYL